jgi:hypothetical protein
MSYCTFHFEEVPVTYKGQTLMADGSFCVEFDELDPDPSVGDPGGPEIVDYSDLEVTLTLEDGETLAVTDKAERYELLKQIARKVPDDAVYMAIVESIR